jgi:hypothetical protein
LQIAVAGFPERATPLQSVVVPSVNVTDPVGATSSVGIPEIPTVVVNVTVWFTDEVGKEDTTETVGVALLTLCGNTAAGLAV